MSTKEEITDLTVCRAFFAAWVFVYHVDLYVGFSARLGSFAGLIHRGYLGVDGFFMLSGFVLAYTHAEFAKLKSGFFKFWGKRLARIYPLHLVTLLLFAVLFMSGLADGITPRDPDRFGLSAFVQNLFLVHGWGWASQGAWNYPSWSISTEWAGYLLFPALLFLVAYFEWYVSMQFIIVGFLALGLIMSEHGHSLNLTFVGGLLRFFPEFIIGICTWRLVSVFADTMRLRHLSLVAGATFIFVGAIAGWDLLTVFGEWSVLYACAMQADAKMPPFFRVPFLRRLGLLSYAFYMSFALAELVISQWFRREGWPPVSHAILFSAGMLAITAGLSVALHLIIEVPARRSIDHWLERKAS
jgi:peptidoglycan/LPS O-acetylase OafA/YrhL